MVIHCVVCLWKKSWLLKQNDYQRRVDYVTRVLDRIDLNLDHNYIKSELLSDEATCSVDTPVNRHTVWIWGSENPMVVSENDRNSLK